MESLENSEGGALVIDNLLTQEALMHLRNFAELSTVWYLERSTSSSSSSSSSSYLGAGLNTGFSTQLLAQVAEELRVLLADVLCDLPLTNVWAFKSLDPQTDELTLHADRSAVTVHFWLSPSGFTEDESKGLTIYDATLDVDSLPFEEGSLANVLPELVRQNGDNISIPHFQNRAVVFDSARIHAKQRAFGKPRGRESQTEIGVSLLFGLKGVYCTQRRSVSMTFDVVETSAGTSNA